jgi:hypothetical protein
MRRLSEARALVLVTALTACGRPSQTSPRSTPATWHESVGPLFQQKCVGCHVEGGIAPFALQTYAQAYPMRDAIKSSVQARTMPPWPPSNECASYLYDRSLSDEELALVTRWVDEGAAEGDASKAPVTSGTSPSGLSRVDLSLPMPTEYTVQKSPDDYRCFILDWPYTDTRYVTGFRADPGNAGIVHHVIAYLATPDQVSEAQTLDDNEPGPGYTCFGGPGLNDGQVAWLGAWAPGTLGLDYPEHTGLRIASGSKVILQVHYNTRHGNGTRRLTDRTSVAFKVDPHVDKVAFMQPWTNSDWVNNKTMNIPAGQADVVHAWGEDPSPSLASLTHDIFKNNQPITLHSAALHMHTLGTHARLEIQRGSGDKECLLDIPRWDFDWQDSYIFTQPKVFNPGDSIQLECHWDNSAPGAADANWGEGTGDEMCLGLFYMTQ